MKLSQSILFIGAQGGLLSEGFAIFIVGMSVVFLALVVLVIILQISGKFFANLDRKKNAEQSVSKTVVAPVEEIPVKDMPTVAQPSEIDDLELVAVITATIAATMGTSSDGLQVRSIRKTNNVWGRSGRKEQLYN